MNEPIEEQICRVMADFRMRRMREMVNCPESITDEDKLSPELSRHAEAAAIARLFPPTPAKAPPPQSWPRKFGQGDRWSFCLTAGTLCPPNQEIR